MPVSQIQKIPERPKQLSMNVKMVPIEYSGFYDAPLAFRFRDENSWYYFWRGYFDDEADDYPRKYSVYRIEGSQADPSVSDWNVEQLDAKKLLGTIPVSEVIFDESKRTSVSIKSVERFLQG